MFGIRAVTFWEVGGLDERFAESMSLLDLTQLVFTKVNYRLRRLRHSKKRRIPFEGSRDKNLGIRRESLPRAELETFKRKHRGALQLQRLEGSQVRAVSSANILGGYCHA
jgi:hypothetical protein